MAEQQFLASLKKNTLPIFERSKFAHSKGSFHGRDPCDCMAAQGMTSGSGAFDRSPSR